MPRKSSSRPDVRLSKDVFDTLFTAPPTQGNVPSPALPPLPRRPASPRVPVRAALRSPQPPRLPLAPPRMGFTRPRAGQPSQLFQEFQALLGWESKAVAQIVYEIIAQTVGWHTPLDPAATESWVLLSLRHFEHTCIMPPSQVLKGLTLARERGYIVRRPAGRAYEYALHWHDEAAHTPQDGDSVSDPLLSRALYIDTSENDDMETDTH